MGVIEFDGVTKRYGGVTALSELELCVRAGEVYGFLGPNGAGKSTTINLVLDFVRPTVGSVRAFGYDAQKESEAIRQRTGVLPEEFELYDRLSGREHLAFVNESKGVATDLDQIAERVGIVEAIDRKVGGYSKGMAQRLALGAALVGEPDLLILDEPSTGLDPSGANRIREIVREETNRGATVFFSSHSLGQVESVCDRVGILREGELVAQDTVCGLCETLGSNTVLTVDVDHVPAMASTAVGKLSGVADVRTTDTTVTVYCDGTAKADVLNQLEATGASIRDFSLEEDSLEELFMAYTDGSVGTTTTQPTDAVKPEAQL